MLVLHLSTNNLEFSRYNTGWNGTSSFFSDLDRHRIAYVYEPGALAQSPKNSTLLIIAPKNHPAPAAILAYRSFVSRGNTLILADDFGTGNEILKGLESHISILPGNLSSLDQRYLNSYMVVAYRESGNATAGDLPASIALDRPAALDGGTPLMLTSVMSWIDANGDRRLNTVEDMGTFPVMSSEAMGSGKIIVLSDPSILINSMYTQPENSDDRELIRGVLKSDGPVLVDQMNSRTADASGISEILHVIRTTIIIEISLLGLLVFALAWTWKKRIF
nr:DUF4350 domain-containing protein [uncultured Methanoregula sp.]